VGGLSTAEIARAFLVPEPTIAQRLVRATRTIRDRELPYEVPEGAELSARLPAALAVVYLIFQRGLRRAHRRRPRAPRALPGGRPPRHLLVELMPHEPEVLGLLALMELQASRAATRTDADGNLVLLADQDRSRWIRRGSPTVSPVSIARGHGGRRAIPAPGRHRRLSRARGLVGGDGLAEDRRPLPDLADVAPSPVVELNRAVAIGLAQGAAAGLAALDGIESAALRGYHLLPPRAPISSAGSALDGGGRRVPPSTQSRR